LLLVLLRSFASAGATEQYSSWEDTQRTHQHRKASLSQANRFRRRNHRSRTYISRSLQRSGRWKCRLRHLASPFWQILRDSASCRLHQLHNPTASVSAFYASCPCDCLLRAAARLGLPHPGPVHREATNDGRGLDSSYPHEIGQL